jgi:hypothetical protein
MDLLLLSTFLLPFLDHHLPWLNSWSSRAGQLDVRSIYFPRAGTLRETDGYGLLVQSGTAASTLPQAGQPTHLGAQQAWPTGCVEETLPHDWIGLPAFFQISLLAAEEAQCHVNHAYMAQPRRSSRVVDDVEV